MEESRYSHRLMRRIALLAAIHGVSVIAPATELSAADFPSFASGQQSILDRSMGPRSPEKLPQVTPNDFDKFLQQSTQSLEFAPTHVSQSDTFPIPLLSPRATDKPKVIAPPAVLPSAPNTHWMPPSIRIPAPVTTAPAPLEDRYIGTRPLTAPTRAASSQKATVAAALSRPQLNPSAPARLPSTSVEQVPSEPAFTAVEAMLQSTPIWIQPHLDHASSLDRSVATKSTQATVHESKLRELAQRSMRDSQNRLQRGATHSAQKIATESLSMLVAMGDAREGGNTHERQLQSALTAIRESKEFWGPRGPIDHDTLVRSIAVHDTTVLKGMQLEDVAALQATELYLDYAKDQLALATGTVREASDVLVLLGQIESRMSAPTDPHAAAVALTMHRAAVQVDPVNGNCRRELGKMLLTQGLVSEAVAELRQSTFLRPTRNGFEALHEAASRAGDVELARHCVAVLNDSGLPLDVPILRLPPEQFASTHRPNAIDMNHSLNAQDSKPDADRDAPKVTEKRSWFPFGRH